MKHVQPKTKAIIEVIVVFIVAAFLLRSISWAWFSVWEAETLPDQIPSFLGYGAVLAFVLALLAITRRDWRSYGITLKDGRLQVRVIAVGFIPMLMLGSLLGMVDWRTLTGSVMVSLATIGILFLIGWVLRDKGNGKGLSIALALLLSFPFASESNPLESVLIQTIYFYFLVGPAEEVLFRGFIQTRLNEVYDKPYREPNPIYVKSISLFPHDQHTTMILMKE